MCGICGIVSIESSSPETADLRPMLNAIAHRGPDGEGLWNDSTTILGHRRLAIIDLDGGQQPMKNEDGSVIVTFNGEIYNHHQLRDQLKKKGHQFKTRCDTEVLVHLWEEEGAGMASSLRGMYAFAIWDKNKKQLFCARDRLGEKPFYYCNIDGRFFFASEIKGILATGENRFHINRDGIDSYLAVLHTIGENTAIREIKRLLPGHTLMVEHGKIRTQSYWSASLGEREDYSVPEWKTKIAEAVERAAGYQTEADVPLGVFLSGGLDSSAIAAAFSKNIADPIKTYSIGFGQADDETPFAREMAEHIGADHTEMKSGENLWIKLDLMQRIYDEPFADSAAIPTLELCRAAVQHVKVIIGGVGGDELFGGYPRYLATKKMMDQGYPFWKLSQKHSFRTPKHPVLSRMLSYWEATHSTEFSNPYLPFFGQPYIGAQIRKQLLGLDTNPTAPTPHESLLLERFDRVLPQFDDGDCCALYDIGAYLPDDLLVKVDLASMSVGLELRSPLLDHELVELALRMPSDVRLLGGQLKGLFRQAVGGWLVDSVLNRKDKKGLGAPVWVWMTNPNMKQLTKDLLLSSNSPLVGLVDMKSVQNLHNSYNANRFLKSYRIWQLVCLALWRKNYPGVNL